MIRDQITRIEAKSLKAQCVEALERLIISGDLAVGETLPPERDLALRLGVSRPVVHEAVVELASRGFVAIEPRRGVKVKDYYRHGTLAIFESIVLNNEGRFPPEVLDDVVGFRSLIELECVRLAALRRGEGFIEELGALVAAESGLSASKSPRAEEVEARAEFDVRFHLLLAEASGNRILPLVMNSISPVQAKLVRRFYASGPDLGLVAAFHRDLVAAIAEGRLETALAVASAMLEHGASQIGAL